MWPGEQMVICKLLTFPVSQTNNNSRRPTSKFYLPSPRVISPFLDLTRLESIQVLTAVDALLWCVH